MHKIAQRIFVALAACFIIPNLSFSQALIGEISKADYQRKHPQVIDAATKLPVEGAAVSIPTENKASFTNSEGYFKIVPSNDEPVILSVQKDGYRPFSITLQDGKLNGNLILELEKSSPKSLVISNNLLHLGDNSYSEDSAGACLINSPCVGPAFTQKFYVNDIRPKTKAYISIGSIIGIDTVQAMRLGQNNLRSATSTPMEVFINKKKIGEIKINGDNQKIPIPLNVLNKKSDNTLTLQTGINQSAKDYIDYDDVELMNVIVDIQ